MSQFREITMIDYGRPLAERAKARKVCGPYRWAPTEPGKGRGFYQARHGLQMDARGSSFALRLESANDHLGASRLSGVNGYYADRHQDSTLTPIIARLPHGRGFLAGWTMGEGMCARLDATIWPDEVEAARAAHDMAEQDAERERDSEDEEGEQDEEEEGE